MNENVICLLFEKNLINFIFDQLISFASYACITKLQVSNQSNSWKLQDCVKWVINCKFAEFLLIYHWINPIFVLMIASDLGQFFSVCLRPLSSYYTRSCNILDILDNTMPSVCGKKLGESPHLFHSLQPPGLNYLQSLAWKNLSLHRASTSAPYKKETTVTSSQAPLHNITTALMNE